MAETRPSNLASVAVAGSSTSTTVTLSPPCAQASASGRPASPPPTMRMSLSGLWVMKGKIVRLAPKGKRRMDAGAHGP